MKRICILLIIVILLIGMVGCGELAQPESEYTPMVAAGFGHTVGLKSDGTVVAIGLDDDGRCDVDDWTGITQVAAGKWHTAGLRYDGTVVAVGNNTYGQCDVGDWDLN